MRLYLLIGCGRRFCVLGLDFRFDCSRVEDDVVINYELLFWVKIVFVKLFYILCVVGKLYLLCFRVLRYDF